MPNPTPDQVVVDAVFADFCADEYPGDDPDETFEKFGAIQVLKPRELTAPELDAGIVDGSRDGGVDSFFVFLNGALVNQDDPRLIDGDPSARGLGAHPEIDVFLVQSKNRTRWEESVWEHLLSSLPNLLQLGADETYLEMLYRSEVVERTRIFRDLAWALRAKFPNVTFRATYVTRAPEANITATLLSKAAQVEAAVRASLTGGASVYVSHVGVSELYTLAGTTYNRPGELVFRNLIREADSFVGVVTIADYLSFVRTPSGTLREELFESNVRDYEGDNSVNEAMATTLATSDNAEFWWLNNGITVLGDAVDSPQLTLTISRPLIVNGLQTSHVLHRAEKDGLIQLERLTDGVVVRVIVSTDEDTRDRIIAGTNRQTQVPTPALYATRPNQIAIEKYLKTHEWYYERRKNRYKNLGKPAKRRVTMNLLAQAMISVMLGRPDDARARPSTLLSKQSGYDSIFPEKLNHEAYLVAIEVLKEVDDFLATPAAKEILDEYTNARFFVAAGYILQKLRISDTTDFHFDSNFRKVKRPLTKTYLAKALVTLKAAATAFQTTHPKATRDSVFKSSEFRENYFAALLSR